MRGVGRADRDVADASQIEAHDRHAVAGIYGKRDGTSGGAGMRKRRCLVVRTRVDHACVTRHRRVCAGLNAAVAATPCGLYRVGGSFDSEGWKNQNQESEEQLFISHGRCLNSLKVSPMAVTGDLDGHRAFEPNCDP